MKDKIRVSTGELKAKEGELAEAAVHAGELLKSVQGVMESVEASFHADAAARVRKAFDRLAEEGQEMIRELGGHIGKLSPIAQNYEKAEKENELVTTDD